MRGSRDNAKQMNNTWGKWRFSDRAEIRTPNFQLQYMFSDGKSGADMIKTPKYLGFGDSHLSYIFLELNFFWNKIKTFS